MAYRYGIPRVHDAAGQSWGRNAIDRSPQPFQKPLTCAGCTVAVIPIRSSTTRRTKSGLPTTVKAHYRLTSGGEHDAQCPFDFERRANGICRDSHGTVEERDGRWRLLLPSEAEVRAMDAPAARDAATRPRRHLQIENSRRRLTAALNSARRILRLLHEFDNDPDELDRFRAMHGARAIRWENFVYGPDDYNWLLDRLSVGAAGHPIAVHGGIHTLSTGKNGTNYLLRAHGRARDTAGPPVPIVVRAKDRALLPAQDDAQWLAYGDWRLWTGARGYRELQLWVHGPWQITTWHTSTPDNAGVPAGQTRSPR